MEKEDFGPFNNFPWIMKFAMSPAREDSIIFKRVINLIVQYKSRRG